MSVVVVSVASDVVDMESSSKTVDGVVSSSTDAISSVAKEFVGAVSSNDSGASLGSGSSVALGYGSSGVPSVVVEVVVNVPNG